MADRYWVGGSGTWNGTNTANWSTTSGGAGGASAPTAVDDVFLNASSGSGTMAIVSGAVCRNVTFDNPAFTLNGDAAVNGNVSLQDYASWGGSSRIMMVGSGNATVSMATGKRIPGIEINKNAITDEVTFITNFTAWTIRVLTGTVKASDGVAIVLDDGGQGLQISGVNAKMDFGNATYTVSGYTATDGCTLVPGTNPIVINSYYDGELAMYDVTNSPRIEIMTGTQGLYVYGDSFPRVDVIGTYNELRIGDNCVFEELNIGPNNLFISALGGPWEITMPSSTVYSCAFKDITIASPETLTVIGGVDLGGTSNIIFTQPSMTASASWIV